MEMKKVPRIVGLKGNGNIFSKYALILTSVIMASSDFKLLFATHKRI
jgi:hypothetical protein